ncbi:P-loop containing nucleoside triphosphate hydrolase protein [Mycena latifolia]|nr:P-loop containing nucleoside triphosphate hydrolase protein [Mycena latifolia]
MDSIQLPHNLSKCPPPSRIFHGRKMILDQMHDFFTQVLGKQHIFVLHGLGGAGKTQIALKFIEGSLNQFSDIFLIDSSTVETIDTGLRNIAVTRRTGITAQDALYWLSSKPNTWLLLFDNADDPKINLNEFFPQCNHGNILITSRNPGLQVYSGSHSVVLDMEKTDAVELLLKSAAKNITPSNTEIASEIVKALWYLPLAIVQAGAFISKSGALESYLILYMENRTRLLSERPVQSHDDYAWTVYTTWQLSFQQLSKPAALFLQLCSFLHHETISEEIFARASVYNCSAHGPSKEELQGPLDLLSHFLSPTGAWDTLRFLDVVNEIRAYSLVNFDPGEKLFSIHPLVQSWTRSIVTEEPYHHWMVAILGMSITGIPWDHGQLAAQTLCSHIDSLISGDTKISPDFREEYGRMYWWGDRLKEAEELQVPLVAHRRSVLGGDHIATVRAMGHLANTYSKLGRLTEAVELQVMVVDKQRNLLGENHPDTLRSMIDLGTMYGDLGQFKTAAELEILVLQKCRTFLGEQHLHTVRVMGNLGSTYHILGQLKEAEELETVVLEKRKTVSGEEHPHTLRAMGNLAATYNKLGRFDQAAELEVLVLTKRRKILGESHLETLQAMSNLAATYKELGREKDAEALELLVVEKRRNLLGGEHPHTLLAMGNLAATYHRMLEQGGGA